MQPIKKDQLVEKGVLDNLTTGLDASIEKTKQASKELEEFIKLQKKVAEGAKNNAKGFKAVAEAERKQVKALSEKEKFDKRILRLEEKKAQVTDAQRKRLEALKLVERERNKIAKQQAILTSKTTGAFEKLNTKIKILSDKYRDLIAQEGKETKQTRLLRKQILALNKVRNQANESLGMHQHKVGQYHRAIGRLRTALSQLGLAFGVFHLLRDTIGIITDFDSAVAELGAVSGKTSEELEPLTNQAKDLGATTQFTASQITALQVELAKLGFTTEEIMASTGPISRFATATGAEIPEAAALAGASLRAFGLDASEMERVVSVLGVATTKTGLDFSFLQTAMSTVAPVANAFNFSIEDTTALLGQLANSGFDASSAATATRNILLNLADANGKLAQELGRPITGANDLAAGLQELQASGINLSEALELTDKRSVAAFETFLKGSSDLVDLRDSITDVSDELETMSAKRLDTIKGATDLLRSAWEGLILEWNEGAGIGESLKNVLLFLAENLKTVVKIVGLAIKAFIAYKIATRLWRIETDAAGNSIAKGLIPGIINYTKSVWASIKAVKAGTISMRQFGLAIKSIPFAQVAALLVTIIPLVWDYVDGLINSKDETEDLTAAQEELNKVSAKTSNRLVDERAILDQVFEALKQTTAGTEERQEALDKVNAKYGTTLQNLEDETAFVNQLNNAYNDLVATLEKRIRLEVVQERLTELIKQKIETEALLAETLRFEEQQGLNQPLQDFNLGEQIKQSDGFKAQLAEINERIAALKSSVEGEDLLGSLLGDTTTTQGGSKLKQRAKDFKTEAELNRQRFADLKKQNKDNLLAIENDLRKSGANQLKIDEGILNAKKNNARIETQFALENFGEFSEEYIKANVELNRLLDEENKKGSDLQKQRFEDLKKQNKENLKILELNLRAEGKTDEEIKEALTQERINQINEELGLVQDVNEALDLQLELLKLRDQQAQTALDKEKEVWKTIRKEISDTAKLFAEYQKQRLSAIDMEIEREQRKFNDSQTREQELRDIANERNLDATESIEFERKLQDEALAQQQELERKKVQTEALIAALKAFAAKVEQGEGDPVGNIKTNLSNLKNFAEGAFYSGTETTLGDALGYTGKRDAHLIIGDEREAIFDPQQTRDLNIGKGGNTTQDIVDMYKGGMFTSSMKLATKIDPVQSIAHSPIDQETKGLLHQIIKNTTPSNQPTGKTDFDALTGILEYTYKTKNTKGRIKYPIRK